jgi:hypothetical protein
LKNPVNDAAAVAMASLEDAIGVFAGPTVEKVDDRHDYGEIRSQTALRSP